MWEKHSPLARVWIPSICGLLSTEEVLLEPRFMDPSPSCLHTVASIRSHCKELRQAVGLEAKLQSSQRCVLERAGWDPQDFILLLIDHCQDLSANARQGSSLDDPCKRVPKHTRHWLGGRCPEGGVNRSFTLPGALPVFSYLAQLLYPRLTSLSSARNWKRKRVEGKSLWLFIYPSQQLFIRC